jgi:pyruvate formate lyase activating enzyme
MVKFGRRQFLKYTGGSLAAACCGLGWAQIASAAKDDSRYSVPARHVDTLENRRVKCKLCPRECVVDDLEKGYCGVRDNKGGTYYSRVYGRLCSRNIDPIEKKPLFHFLPGTTAYSIATVGCNVNCKFCQNWQISQVGPGQVDEVYMPPTDIVEDAIRWQAPTISYTYSEPVIFFEYMYDTAAEGRKKGIRSVMVTNGYIQEQPMQELCQVLDAVKVDLKAFTETFYQEQVSGELKPVLDTLVRLKGWGMWTEIVYLMIPTLNDQPKDLEAMCHWIMTELGPDVPLHFTRFHPEYLLMNLPVTPLSSLETGYKVAKDAGIHYVYLGNVPANQAESTYCPVCNTRLVHRQGFTILQNQIVNNSCPKCGNHIPGIWQ